MQKNDQKIKDIFQDKLDEHRFSFKEEAWGEMEMLLDTALVPVKLPFWKTWTFWTSTIAAAVLIGTGYSFYENNTKEERLVETKQEVKILTPIAAELEAISTEIDVEAISAGNTILEQEPALVKDRVKALNTNASDVIVSSSLAFRTDETSELLSYQAKGDSEQKFLTRTKKTIEEGIVQTEIAKENIPVEPIIKEEKPIVVEEDVAFFTALEDNLTKAYRHYAPEKVYLHLDRKQFAVGESIWFAAYVRAADDFNESKKSDLLHVQFLDAEGRIHKQMTIVKKDGQFRGDIQLPVDLGLGKYKIKAYTNWQRNLGQYFERDIEIVSALKDEKNLVVPKSKGERIIKDIDVQFFPEGGTAIANSPTKIAFKAIADDGLSVDVKGVIVDGEGTVLKMFESIHAGMGAVELAALEAGMLAKIEMPDGSVRDYALPIPRIDATTLNVIEQNDEKLKILLHSTQPKVLNIVLESRQKIYFKRSLYVNKKGESLEIESKGLPMGIASLSVFDGANVPVAERLVFLNKNRQIQAKISSKSKTYYKGETIALDVELADEHGHPVQGVFSLGVTKAQGDEQGHLLSSYLLESELEGKVEQANFYFDKNQDSHLQKEALDCLMLTQGYRSFSWEKWGAAAFAKMDFKAERALVSGVVQDEKGQAIANSLVRIAGARKKVVTDANGRYELDASDMDNDGLVLNAAQGRLKGYKKIDRFGTGHHIVVRQNLELNGQVRDEEGKAIAGAKIYAKANPALLYRSDENGEYRFNYDKTGIILIAEKKGYLNREFMLNENNHFVDIRLEKKSSSKAKRKGTGLKQESTFGGVGESGTKGELELSVARAMEAIEKQAKNKKGKGIPFLEGEKAKKYNRQIKAYTYLLEEYLEESKKEKLSNEVLETGLLTLNQLEKEIERLESDLSKNNYLYALNFNNGYYRARHFYRPKYKQKKEVFQKDWSSTLYWNAALETDESGKARITFDASEWTGLFEVVLEGLSKEGGLAHTEYRFESKAAIQVEQTKQPRFLDIQKGIIEIPLIIENKTGEKLSGKWAFDLPRGMKRIKGERLKEELLPYTKKEKIFRFKVKSKTKEALRIAFKTKQHKAIVRVVVE